MKIQIECLNHSNINGSKLLFMFNGSFYIDYLIDGDKGLGIKWIEMTFSSLTTRDTFFNKLYLTTLHKTFDTIIYLCEYKKQKILLHVTWN